MPKYILYITALIFTCLTFFFQVSPVVASSYIHQALGLNDVEISRITSLFLLVYGVMQIPNGLLINRFGLRLLPIYVSITFIGSLVYWLDQSVFTLVLNRLLTGFGCSIAFTVTVYIAVKIFSVRRMSFFVALVSVSASSGAILATEFFQLLLIDIGWYFTHLSIIAIIFFLVVLNVIYSKKAVVSQSCSLNNQQSFLWQIKQVLMHKELIATFLYSFFTWFIVMAFAGYWAKEYFEIMHDYSQKNSLVIMQTYWVGYLFACLCIPFFIKSLVTCKKVICLLSLINVITFCFMAIPIIFDYSLIFWVILFAALSTAGIPLGFSIISMSAPKEIMALSISINNTFVVLGGLLGELLFSFIIDKFSQIPFVLFSSTIIENYYFALLLLPAASIAAFVALIWGIRRF